MESFAELARLRRSHRKYTEEPVSRDELRTILASALMSPSAKGLRKWRFFVTEDRNVIRELSTIRPGGSHFLESAPCVVAVCGEPDEQEMWIEDGSIAAVTMQYQAQDLGLGSCWCQIRGRQSADEGKTAEDRVREIMDIGGDCSVLCLLAFGHPCDERQPQNPDSLKWDNVRW